MSLLMLFVPDSAFDCTGFCICQVTSVQRDAISCIVHLLGTGFVTVTMNFLLDASPSFDGVSE